jgi:hypothetical protein
MPPQLTIPNFYVDELIAYRRTTAENTIER